VPHLNPRAIEASGAPFFEFDRVELRLVNAGPFAGDWVAVYKIFTVWIKVSFAAGEMIRLIRAAGKK